MLGHGNRASTCPPCTQKLPQSGLLLQLTTSTQDGFRHNSGHTVVAAAAGLTADSTVWQAALLNASQGLQTRSCCSVQHKHKATCTTSCKTCKDATLPTTQHKPQTQHSGDGVFVPATCLLVHKRAANPTTICHQQPKCRRPCTTYNDLLFLQKLPAVTLGNTRHVHNWPTRQPQTSPASWLGNAGQEIRQMAGIPSYPKCQSFHTKAWEGAPVSQQAKAGRR